MKCQCLAIAQIMADIETDEQKYGSTMPENKKAS